MSNLQAALAILGALVVLAGVGAAISVYFRGTSQEIRIKRLTDENTEYLARINYLEPRYDALEKGMDQLQKQNDILRTLVDPTPQLKQIGATLETVAQQVLDAVQTTTRNTDAIKAVILNQARIMDEIREKVHAEDPE